ncbi:hypothetical protein K461DRAFT_229577 [Myriangium duriaei CBS 260.36]|uniref:Histidine kinase n=1 Tax=Myriangium duriaei CBS 260.36 TaxID=1168546 RepID=A0A9P4IVZ5_9PEZI|nr:hypothetical protein K461DRAFT_229577 [Myriangium duriaei CBS 260.36]
MLSKAKTEDGHIKTVSLPRGTVATPAGISALQMRAPSDRSSAARSSSPDSSIKADSSSFSVISSIGVVELLEQDERPTLIVDLGDSANYGSGQLRPVFANSSLRSYPGLVDLVIGSTDDPNQSESEKHSYIEFKSWLLSASINGESLNVCLPSFEFAGVTWSCSTLRKRLRLVSGSFTGEDSSPRLRQSSRSPKVSSSHTQSAPHKPAQSPLKQTTDIGEPPDYFGDATYLRPTETAKAVSGGSAPPTGSPQSLKHSTQTPLSSGLAAFVTEGSGPVSLEDVAAAVECPSFDWTRIPVSDSMPDHIKFARSIDWASTALGPIEDWCADLRQMCNLVMASPHPAAMYWGEELIAIYNEAYVLLAGQKHPELMGLSYKVAWKEIWDEVKDVFLSAVSTGEATMKDDDCLFMKRNGFLEETYFSWSIIPLVGSDGAVVGLYNPCFEKTRRKIAERRMLTLREIGERTATARDLRGFWEQVISALEANEYDTPVVLLYSVSDDSDSDSSSIHSVTMTGAMMCHLEGTLGVPADHPSAPATIDLRSSTDGFAQIFQQVLKTDKPVLLDVEGDLPPKLLDGLESRGFGDEVRAIVVCPIHPTTGESTLGFLILGVNPRRPYDEDYSLFVQLLSRQLATSLASVVLFEEEIRRGQRAARLAALDRMELSEQLAARTQEAIDSETKFTRMAEFAPVGMFIANSEGLITYCNDTWYEISRISKNTPVQKWMDSINDEDRQMVSNLWRELVDEKKPLTAAFRFKAPWQNPAAGLVGERWVLFSAYPEKHPNDNLKSVFGSFTDISQQKWAEGFQKRKMEEAVELKRQQENFIDMTSHEMRNPLSAILQCADEISTTMTSLRERQSNADKSNGLDTTITSALEAAQTIALCAQHQKRIVDDILTLSKLDSELLLVTPVDAQPLTVVQRALKMHEGELSSNDIKLKFVVNKSYEDLKIDWVRFDPSRVLQVLINLTTNAIKFTTTETERTITVSIGAFTNKPSSLQSQPVEYFPSKRSERIEDANADWGDGEDVYIHFAVQDTGRGLTNEEKKMLFLRFSQASPRTHVQYGGSGLGLFISRQLTELQGGEIGVASEAGKGSTFAFYVRARRSTGPSDDKDRANGSAAHVNAAVGTGSATDGAKKPLKPVGTKYILLVEDNLVNQRVLQKQLKNLGCVVQVANHGGEALDRLKQSTWSKDLLHTDKARTQLSVVLMDQEMPVMDGLTATRKIRTMEKKGDLVGHVPVIGVTANARSEQIQTALDAGMDDVVSKPFRIPDLIPKIEELMGRHPEPGTETPEEK